MMYNYYEAMKNDIKDYIESEIEYTDFATLEELEETLQDTLWTVDSVTGNGSGSYTFNRHEAKDYVTDNMKLCTEALREFCVDMETVAEKFLNEDWKYFDVTIRCYVLHACISDVMEEIEEAFTESLAEMDDFRDMEEEAEEMEA
jgi:hypothetical protein